jgi:hypothetical protein
MVYPVKVTMAPEFERSLPGNKFKILSGVISRVAKLFFNAEKLVVLCNPVGAAG